MQTPEKYESRRKDETLVLIEADTAVKFLLGSFISLDILSCASTRSAPLLELDHILALEGSGTHLENLTGCENWAMILILKISRLDDWKRTAEQAHKLSMVELVERGAHIERSLREGLDSMEAMPSLGTSLGTLSGSLLPSPHIESTKIFALAAMTYLHVVISGAHPELPEISRSVSQTISVFQSITNRDLLRNLVWPFCISGCLALEVQQGIFRDLFSAVDITHHSIGTFLEAMKIMEECWETRKTSPCVDWVSAMNKRGYYVLLR